VLLDFLFSTLARKTPPIGLREGAEVARYLDHLSWESGPGPQGQLLRELSRVIWGTVLQGSEFKTAEKDLAIEFLKQVADTHLASFDVAAAIETVRSLPPPKEFSPLPTLRAPFMSVTMGPETRRLATDLSERICAGYWALRFARIAGARQHVADALNRHGIPCRRQEGTESLWAGYEVAERLKEYEKSGLIAPNGDRTAGRRALVTRWNHLYYPHPAWEKSSSATDSGRHQS
jgi:hypothetical protein